MKHLLIWLLLSATAFAQVGAIASRRTQELTPLGYKFGPFTAVAPFDNQPGYSLVTNAGQLQPPNLITANDNFASTSEFATAFSTGSPTFTVASNQGTITIPSSSSLASVDTTASLTVPQQFVQMTIDTVPTSGIVAVGIFSSTEGFYAEYNPANGYFGVAFFNGSTYNYSSGKNPGAVTAPFRLGFSLVGNEGVVWLNTGTGWQMMDSLSSSSYYNFETSGNLTGWHSGWYFYGSSATVSYVVSAFKAGSFGGVGIRDISLVTYPDGRPYIQGAIAYFTATTCDPVASCYDGVYTYNLSTGALTQIGVIFDSRGGFVYPDVASDLVYDPQSAEFYYVVGGWGAYTTSFPPSYLDQFASSTANPLNGGVFALSGTEMTLPYNSSVAYDSHLACTQFDYSTDACSYWLLAFSTGSITANTALAYTTSAPSANSWTGIFNPGTPVTEIYEGDRIIRTATGAGGVTYYVINGGNSSAGYEVRQNVVYSPTGTLLGYLDAPLPAGGHNAPHPQLFSYGNTEYYFTFTDGLWGSTANTMGDWVVATAPKYATQTNWPTQVNEGSSFSSSTSVSSVAVSAGTYSSTFTVAAGQLIVGACRGANTAETSSTVTDSLGNTFTNMALNLNGSGFTDGFYGFATVGGTDTFTCTLGAASTYTGLTVEQFTPGFLTAVDYTGYSNQSTSSTLYTSGSFSTTAKGLVIACPDGLFGGGNFQPGFIGTSAAAFGAGLSSGSAPCEGVLTTGAQTSITATLSSGNGTAGTWGGVIMSFK